MSDDDLDFDVPGFNRRWLDNNRIVIFTLRDMSRRTLDTAAQIVLETMQNWPNDQLYLAGYDLSAPSIMLSPYARQHLEELRHALPELKGFVAAMVDPGIIAQMISLFSRSVSNEARPMRVFTDDTEALRWLRSHLPTD